MATTEIRYSGELRRTADAPATEATATEATATEATATEATATEATDPGWVKEWPEAAGTYWFYGWTSEFGRRTGDGPRLTVVKVHRNDKSVFRVADGHFLYPSEGGKGFFKPLVAPDLPDISSLA